MEQTEVQFSLENFHLLLLYTSTTFITQVTSFFADLDNLVFIGY